MNRIISCLIFSLFASAYGQLPKWCVYSTNAKQLCDSVANAISSGFKFSCVLGSDEKDCYKKIASKQADFGVFDGGMILQGGREHDLRVIMSETLKNVAQEATSYYAVAVVKKTSGLTINSIKGKKSCHTGVQKTSGWQIPVGALLSRKIMKWQDCNQYSTVAGFFSGSCAPGANDPKYNPGLRNESKLCSQCAGSGADKCSRSSKEPYYSYEGAFKCLKDGKGDVAFLKASIVLSASDKNNYQLLCLNGTVADPSGYETCNLARVSSHGVMARKDSDIAKYQNILKEADSKFGEKSTSSVKLYSTDYLFSKGTIGLSEVVSAKQPYNKYLDESYMQDVSVLESCAKLCVTSDNGLKACNTIRSHADSIACVRGTSEADCAKKIADKQADVGMFDGGAIYHAGKDHGLKVIMSEKLKGGMTSDTSYFAVAVVKKDSSLTIKTLKGTKSCHTGVQKTSGWVVPIGHLIRNKFITWTKDCDQYASVSNFFSASCAPGAGDLKYNKKKAGTDKLCSLCTGNGNEKCMRNTKEPYYGYGGAFKCLNDGKGDVAFIKQSTVLGGTPANYKLLCKDGTKKDPKDYASCNLARVPSHAMLTRADAPITQYQGIFHAVAASMGPNLYLPPDAIFSDNTESLVNVTADKQSHNKYLDKAYMEDIAALEGCTASSASYIQFNVGLISLLWLCFKIFA